jgi:hypothetical protein
MINIIFFITDWKKKKEKKERFNDHEIHWHRVMSIVMSRNRKSVKSLNFIYLLTAIGNPDVGLVGCKYCAVRGSAWKKSSPFPPEINEK